MIVTYPPINRKRYSREVIDQYYKHLALKIEGGMRAPKADVHLGKMGWTGYEFKRIDLKACFLRSSISHKPDI